MKRRVLPESLIWTPTCVAHARMMQGSNVGSVEWSSEDHRTGTGMKGRYMARHSSPVWVFLKTAQHGAAGKKFPRRDKREDHFKASGRTCIMPLVEEKLRNNPGDECEALVSGEEKLLPNFSAFLVLCGLRIPGKLYGDGTSLEGSQMSGQSRVGLERELN